MEKQEKRKREEKKEAETDEMIRRSKALKKQATRKMHLSSNSVSPEKVNRGASSHKSGGSSNDKFSQYEGEVQVEGQRDNT